MEKSARSRADFAVSGLRRKNRFRRAIQKRSG